MLNHENKTGWIFNAHTEKVFCYFFKKPTPLSEIRTHSDNYVMRTYQTMAIRWSLFIVFSSLCSCHHIALWFYGSSSQQNLSIINSQHYTLSTYTKLTQIIDKQLHTYTSSLGLREHQQSINHTLNFERISYRDDLAELPMRLFFYNH